MSETYDVVVVGCGPAGATAAYRCARSGLSVLALERDPEVGAPVRCAEVTSPERFAEFFPVPDSIILNKIRYEEVITPDGTHTRFPAKDLALFDRKKMDACIMELACDAGADLLVCADVTGMERIAGGWTVRFSREGHLRNVTAGLVVAADGVESRVARWAGIATAVSPSDCISAYQYDLTDLNLEAPDSCRYFVGSDAMPTGYAWVFPKSPVRANVGIGIIGAGKQQPTAKECLDRFVGERFPSSRALSAVCGGVPVSKPLKEPFGYHLVIVGDAARLANPVSGAGILTGVMSGYLAGTVASKAFEAGNFSRRMLSTYATALNKAIGKRLKLLYAVGRIFRSVDSDELSRINKIASELGPEKSSLYDLCRIAARNDPKLLAKVVMKTW